eukprot:Nk52_evm22s316 gene=Nk52_evmTU22s316
MGVLPWPKPELFIRVFDYWCSRAPPTRDLTDGQQNHHHHKSTQHNNNNNKGRGGGDDSTAGFMNATPSGSLEEALAQCVEAQLRRACSQDCDSEQRELILQMLFRNLSAAVDVCIREYLDPALVHNPPSAYAAPGSGRTSPFGAAEGVGSGNQNHHHYSTAGPLRYYMVLDYFYYTHPMAADQLQDSVCTVLYSTAHFPSVYALLFHNWLFACTPVPSSASTSSSCSNSGMVTPVSCCSPTPPFQPPDVLCGPGGDEDKNSASSNSSGSREHQHLQPNITLKRFNVWIKGANRLFWFDTMKYAQYYRGLYIFCKKLLVVRNSVAIHDESLFDEHVVVPVEHVRNNPGGGEPDGSIDMPKQIYGSNYGQAPKYPSALVFPTMYGDLRSLVAAYYLYYLPYNSLSSAHLETYLKRLCWGIAKFDKTGHTVEEPGVPPTSNEISSSSKKDQRRRGSIGGTRKKKGQKNTAKDKRKEESQGGFSSLFSMGISNSTSLLFSDDEDIFEEEKFNLIEVEEENEAGNVHKSNSIAEKSKGHSGRKRSSSGRGSKAWLFPDNGEEGVIGRENRNATKGKGGKKRRSSVQKTSTTEIGNVDDAQLSENIGGEPLVLKQIPATAVSSPKQAALSALLKTGSYCVDESSFEYLTLYDYFVEDSVRQLRKMHYELENHVSVLLYLKNFRIFNAGMFLFTNSIPEQTEQLRRMLDGS